MTARKPKRGFDWDHIVWGKLDARVSVLCSYCSAGLSDDDVPLMLFTDDGHSATFCDACVKRWWS